MDRQAEATEPRSQELELHARTAARAQQGARLRNKLVALDLGALAVAWMAVLLVADGHGVRGLASAQRAMVGVAGLVATGLALQRQQLYRSRTCSILANELRGLARAVAVGGLAAFVVDAFFWPPASAGRALAGAVLSFVLLVAGRLAYEARLRWLRTHGVVSRPVVLIGSGDHAARLAEILQGQPEFGYEIVGYLGPTDALSPRLTWLGTLDDPVGKVLRRGAGGVVVAAGDIYDADLATLAREMATSGIHMQVSPGLLGVDRSRLQLTPVAHEPLLYVEPPRHNFYERRGKRLFDLAVAGVSLLVAVPLGVLIALAVKLGDGGPVFYRQERIGWHGRPFVMLKFRTMRLKADTAVAELASSSFRTGPLFKLRDDPRVTRVGAILRASNLDELPQLLNVLAGQMSIVGPRPALASEVREFDERHRIRQALRPGVTGLWQVEAEKNELFSVYRHLDIFYVENLTLGLDLSIVVATVAVMNAHLIAKLTSRLRRSTPPSGLQPQKEGA